MILEIIVNYIYLIICIILSVLIFLFITLRKNRKNRLERFRKAATVFQDSVLDELKGLYPIPRHIDPKTCEKFAESIPGINIAADEFRQFVPSENRNAFDDALSTHSLHCEKIDWTSCVTFKIKPGERKPEDEGPKEIFRQNVIKLLSFAKDSSLIEQKSEEQ